MNQHPQTYIGRLSNSLKLHHTGTGSPVVKFSMAIPDGYYDRAKGAWVNRPSVWFDVVIFQPRLAQNVFDTLTELPGSGKGIEVVVLGTLSDNSYTQESTWEGGEDIVIRRTQLVAQHVGFSATTATMTITPDATARERATARATTDTGPTSQPDTPEHDDADSAAAPTSGRARSKKAATAAA